jgi:hypothetical protein
MWELHSTIKQEEAWRKETALLLINKTKKIKTNSCGILTLLCLQKK